jgi:hypothetical protein
MKRAGTRIFRLDGDRWIDVGMKPDLTVYKVQAYSAEYFTLLEKLPELREAFTLGDKVTVAGRTVAVELVEEEVRDVNVDRIAAGFR